MSDLTVIENSKNKLVPILESIGNVNCIFEDQCEIMKPIVNELYPTKDQWDSDKQWILNQIKRGASKKQKEIISAYEKLKELPKAKRDETVFVEARNNYNKVIKQLSYFRDKIAENFYNTSKKNSSNKTPESGKPFIGLMFEDYLHKNKSDIDKLYQKELKTYLNISEEEKLKVEDTYKLITQMYNACIKACDNIRKKDNDVKLGVALADESLNEFISSSLLKRDDEEEDDESEYYDEDKDGDSIDEIDRLCASTSKISFGK